MPRHTTEDHFSNSHYVDQNNYFTSKGEEVVFQDSKDGLYYVLTLDDGAIVPVLLDPQPTYI